MNATILSTKTATINGKSVTVETILGTKHKQDISYSVDGQPMGFNEFWEQEPVFMEHETAEAPEDYLERGMVWNIAI
jgi:hypothetical protein